MCNPHSETTGSILFGVFFQLVTLSLIITSLGLTFDVSQDASQLLVLDRLALVVGASALVCALIANGIVYYLSCKHASSVRNLVQLGSGIGYSYIE